MLDAASRGRGTRRGAALTAGLILGSILIIPSVQPRAADAMCCNCSSCGGAAFCVDALPSSLACANFCVAAGCNSTVFDSVDTCAGGCDGATPAPSATASNTPSSTPSTTPTHTPTNTPSSTPTRTPTVTQTATASLTATNSATPSITPTPPPTGTPTQTPTITPTPTPTPPSELSGHVRYYSDNGPVPGVDVELIGVPTGLAMTDANGNYGFPSVPTSFTTQPGKQDDVQNAVTALDATLVLQFQAGLLPNFTADQKLAGDVTGNGTVTALDATRILQFQAGLLPRFEVANVCQSDWVFRPEPAAIPGQTLVQPQISPGMCVKGAIMYSNFNPPVSGQDYVGILFGDTSGNWPNPVPTLTPTPMP